MSHNHHQHHHHHHHGSNRFSGDPDSLRDEMRNKQFNVPAAIDLVLETFQPKSVCDIGCGSGNFSSLFHEKGIAVAGVDANERMLEAARKHIPNMDVRLSTAEDLPFEDNAFDLSFLAFVFHEVDDQLKVLKEANRVATKGIVIFDFPHDRYFEFGPPQKIRIVPDTLREQCAQLGLPAPEVIEHQNSMLYFISLA